ncbi:MAG: protein BatD [Calditrichaeota bacterium]|nr:protein BatD [Calditrichota bacterium]
MKLRFLSDKICGAGAAAGVFLLAFAAVAGGQDLSVRLSVTPSTVPLTRAFTVQVTLSGPRAQGVAEVKPPDLSAFARFLGSRGTSQSIQIINGRMSVTKTFSFDYMPTKTGTFTVPPVVVKVAGQTYKSDKASVKITSAPPPPQAPAQPQARSRAPAQPGQQSLGDLIFLRVRANKRTVYQGEPVVLTYSLYTRLTVTGYAITKMPSTTGFWTEELDLPQPPPTRDEVLNGQSYVVADIKKLVLFPTSPGKVKVDPMTVDCDVRLPRRRSNDIFDSFFDDPFFGRTVRRTLSSPSLTITVKPLPAEGKPADFSGAVGHFKMSASVDKQAVKTNEALTLKVRIWGSGNVRMISEPKLQLPPDFEQYEPKVTEKIDKSGNTIRGSKTFEYVLIPRFPGEQRIKPIRFSFFDPRAGKYKTLTSPEFVIQVARGAATPVAAGGAFSKEEVRLLGQDIRFIKTEAHAWRRVGRHFHQSPWFVLLLVFPLLAVSGAYGYRVRQDKLAENIALARARRANREASKRLKKARSLLAVETQKDFYAEVARSLLGFLADKFNLPAAGLVSEDVEGHLRRRNVEEELIRETLALLQDCDFHRFAPTESSTENMQATLKRAEKLIERLAKVL